MLNRSWLCLIASAGCRRCWWCRSWHGSDCSAIRQLWVRSGRSCVDASCGIRHAWTCPAICGCRRRCGRPASISSSTSLPGAAIPSASAAAAAATDVRHGTDGSTSAGDDGWIPATVRPAAASWRLCSACRSAAAAIPSARSTVRGASPATSATAHAATAEPTRTRLGPRSSLSDDSKPDRRRILPRWTWPYATATNGSHSWPRTCQRGLPRLTFGSSRQLSSCQAASHGRSAQLCQRSGARRSSFWTWPRPERRLRRSCTCDGRQFQPWHGWALGFAWRRWLWRPNVSWRWWSLDAWRTRHEPWRWAWHGRSRWIRVWRAVLPRRPRRRIHGWSG